MPVRYLYKLSLPSILGTTMKKSEKVKGKERVETQNKQIKLMLGGAIAALIIITVVGYFFFNSSGARSGDTVAVYYTGTLDDGTEFDSKVNGTPLIFTIGKGKIIFEDAVIGMEPNTTKTVRIPANKAYGPYKDALVHTVNRSTLPDDMDPVIGNHYTVTRSPDGAVALVKIINMTSSTVTWDENHELAGKDLTFTITLNEIAR
jgi:peptidylprolyl isomerase